MQEQSQTSTKLSKTGSSQALEVMTPSQALSRYHREGKKLVEFSKAVPESVVKRFQLDLLKISKHLGIQNPPNEEELMSIIVFLVNNFKDFTPSEIYHAFELYASGMIKTIEVAGRTQPIDKPFGTFNLLFIGDVLNGYRAHRKAHLNADPVPVERQIEAPKPIDDIEWQNMNHALIKNYIDENKKLPIVGDFAAAFQYLERAKMIEMTTEEKSAFLYQHREEEVARLQESRSANPFDRFRIDAEIKQLLDEKSEHLRRSARAALAKQFFNNYIKETK